jgi:Tetratricopeptide repeat
LREALALTSPDPLGPAWMNLGIGLRMRYERVGNPADLDDGIACLREALALTSPDQSDRAVMFANLGNGLQRRYERGGNPADVEEGIACWREALRLTPPDHPGRAWMIDNLGNGLRARYGRNGKSADLEEAIACSRGALSLTPLDQPSRAGLLNNLGSGLLMRYNTEGNPADLDEAIGCFAPALQLTPEVSPGWQPIFDNLRTALKLKQSLVGGTSSSAIVGGVVSSTKQAPDGIARLSVTVALAYAVAEFRRGSWREAASLYAAAFAKRELALGRTALADVAPRSKTSTSSSEPRSAEPSPQYSDRLEFLQSFANAGANAALALLRAGGAGAADQAATRHRLKMPADDALASAARQAPPTASDPDTAPANWSHPHFWAAWAIHGAHDGVGT